MQNIFAIWLSLLASLAVIGLAGVLSRYGDIIAEKAGVSAGGWVCCCSLFLYLYGN